MFILAREGRFAQSATQGERVKSCDDTFSNAARKRDPQGLMKRRGLQTVHSPAYGLVVVEPGGTRTPGLLHAMQALSQLSQGPDRGRFPPGGATPTRRTA